MILSNVPQDVYTVVSGKLTQLLAVNNYGSFKASLAAMRRGVGHVPGEIPELWGMFLADIPPEEMTTNRKEPTKEEWAIYMALTLFAVHQQGHDPQNEPMNKEGQSFGAAVAKLVHGEDQEERILRRFNVVATSADMPELAHHMRHIIQLLRGDGIPLDYPALARDIYWYQFPEYRSNVRLRWGRHYYGALRANNKQNEKNNPEKEEKVTHHDKQ